MAIQLETIPKPGTIIKLEDGVELKVIPNLTQIINKEDSCVGCYFNDKWKNDCCGLHHVDHLDLPKMCVSHFGAIDKQIIYVKEEQQSPHPYLLWRHKMKLKTILRILTTPSCWIRNYKTDLIWDMKLNQLLDQHNFTDIGEYTAELGPTRVWIKNHPYASFTPYSFARGAVGVLPTRETVFRAYDKLVHQMINV